MFVYDRLLPFESKLAMWNSEHQVWYGDDSHLEKLGHSILYPPYYTLHSTTECWNCKRKTPVVTLGASRIDHHRVPNGVMHGLDEYVLICYAMSQLPDDIINHLSQNECFGRVHTKSQGSYWGNRCIKCGMVQGDYYLGYGCVFEGPFNPYSEWEHERIIKPIEDITGKRTVSLFVTMGEHFTVPVAT